MPELARFAARCDAMQKSIDDRKALDVLIVGGLDQ
jgi:hypothetical protein